MTILQWEKLKKDTSGKDSFVKEQSEKGHFLKMTILNKDTYEQENLENDIFEIGSSEQEQL